jgi:hypothetical protein
MNTARATTMILPHVPPPVLPAAALLALLLTSGCREPAPEITGVRVTASFPGQDVTQLSFQLLAATGPLAPRTLRPAAAGASLPSPQSFVYYLAGERQGSPVTCRVKGLLRDGRVVARGGATVEVKQGALVDCQAVLGPLIEGDDGTDSEGCADGGREGFLATSAFPRLAACGGEKGQQLHYQSARAQAKGICAAGWRLCGPGALRDIPDAPAPTWLGGTDVQTCAWLDKETTGCALMDLYYTNTSCFAIKLASGSLEGTGPCDLPTFGGTAACTEAWRLAILLGPDQWIKVSVKDGNACYKHVAVACGSAPEGPKGKTPPAQCWVGCCKD